QGLDPVALTHRVVRDRAVPYGQTEHTRDHTLAALGRRRTSVSLDRTHDLVHQRSRRLTQPALADRGQDVDVELATVRLQRARRTPTLTRQILDLAEPQLGRLLEPGHPIQ